jgi:hypothetical protein
MISSSLPAAGERLLLLVAALTVGILAGAFVARVDIIWVVGIIGVLAALAMIFSREATLWFVIVAGIAVVGTSGMYVPGTGAFKYIPPLAAAALLLHTLSEWLQHPRRSVPSTVQLLLCFVAVSLLAMAANWEGFGMAAVGLKSYYPMWTLFLALAMIQWRPQVLDSLPRLALWLALLQLPFVVHQFLFLVPIRENMPGVVAVDIVAGTFGGDIGGGGANSAVTVFLIIVAACLLGMWRHRALSAPLALGGVLLLLAPVLVNSARVALIYLPIAFVVVFFGDAIRHPLRTFAALLVASALLTGMLMSYTALNQTPGIHTWQDLVVKGYEHQFTSERERGDDYSSLTRWTVLTFWAEQHRRRDLMEALIGHGPGASRVEEQGLDLAATLAEWRYGGRQIGYTAVAALLWDVGVLGLAVVLALFWAGYGQARRLVRYYSGRDPTRAGIAQGLCAGVVLLALSLAHKDLFVSHIPYQTLVVCVFGYLAAQIRRVDAAELAADEHATKERGQWLAATDE